MSNVTILVNQLSCLSRVVSIFFLLPLLCSSCGLIHTDDELTPRIHFDTPNYVVETTPTAFAPLTPEELNQVWAKEMILGEAFARELDLYRAITCYKSALILLPHQHIERRLQITYDIILCYYMGHKFHEALSVFENSELIEVNALFPAYNNLLILLYDAYIQTDQCDKAEQILEIIDKCSPETAEDLQIYHALNEGDICVSECLISNHRDSESIRPYFDSFYAQMLSPKRARLLNALLPGAGYYYIGQKKSAVTSFMINALFTAAAYQLFNRGYWAGGAILTSFEMGWYIGGINGAGIEAQEFNNQLYRGMATKLLSQQKFFPVLMFETTF